MKSTLLIIAFFGFPIFVFSQIVKPTKLPETVTCKHPNAPLRASPDPSTDIIGEIPRYTTLEVTDYYETYLKVKFDSLEGYISYIFLNGYSVEFRSYLEYAKSLDELNIKNNLEEKEKTRLEELTKKFGKWASEKIIQKKIWIGMTEEMLLESQGRPIDINRTETSNISHKQYVYSDNKYVYVENGKVTAYQD